MTATVTLEPPPPANPGTSGTPAAAPPPADQAPPAPAAEAPPPPDVPAWGVHGCPERDNAEGAGAAGLRILFVSSAPDAPARAAADALVTRGLDDDLRRRLPECEPVSRCRDLRTKLAAARKELAAVRRKKERAALDREDLLGGSLSGEKLAKALGKADAEARAAARRLGDAEAGLRLLERHAAQADAGARAAAKAASAAAGHAAWAELEARRAEVQAALAAAAAPHLAELLEVRLAAEVLAPQGYKEARGEAVLAELLGGDGPGAPGG